MIGHEREKRAAHVQKEAKKEAEGEKNGHEREKRVSHVHFVNKKCLQEEVLNIFFDDLSSQRMLTCFISSDQVYSWDNSMRKVFLQLITCMIGIYGIVYKAKVFPIE